MAQPFHTALLLLALALPARAQDATGVLDQAIREAGAPTLEALILRSRDQAVAEGVEPVPEDVRAKVAGSIPGEILATARFRVAGGDETSLQFNAMEYGDTLAMTLDDVIVFKDEHAVADLTIWVHELTHVAQYRRWGTLDFATRYLSDRNAVEKEAYDAEHDYVARAKHQTP